MLKRRQGCSPFRIFSKINDLKWHKLCHEVIGMIRRGLACFLCVCFLMLPVSAEDYIKWVDFDVPVSALKTAMQIDIDSQGQEPELDWIEILALAATRRGGGNVTVTQVQQAAESLRSGQSVSDILGQQKKYYDYYYEAYDAVLGGLLGKLRHTCAWGNMEDGVWFESLLPDCCWMGVFALSRLWKCTKFWLCTETSGQ